MGKKTGGDEKVKGKVRLMRKEEGRRRKRLRKRSKKEGREEKRKMGRMEEK